MNHICTTNPPMTNIQIELFWKEIGLIQNRHSLFFPHDQLKYISLVKNESGHYLNFLEGCDLPASITLEIQLSFKIIADLHLE